MTRLAFLAGLALATSVAAQPDAGVGKPVIAVLYFDVDDKLGDLTMFRKGLAEMLITDLVSAGGIDVVERARIEDAMKELKLQSTKNFDQKTAVQVGGMVGAHYQVAGTILRPSKNTLLLESKIYRLLDMKVVVTARAKITSDDIFEGEQQLVAKLVAGLADTAKLALAVPAKKPVKLKLDTAAKYGESLEARDAKDPAKAKTLLDQVVKEQPDFILARLDLAALAK
ncbi:MAG: CsgG/HfaB family protein [Myxococcales bacterium]|nr:CsgG/HfaB family protein [Myxococcales bacterium]